MGNFSKYLEIKNLTESAGKYLKITQGEFRKAKIGLQNCFSSVVVSQAFSNSHSLVWQGKKGLAKISQGEKGLAKISSALFALYPTTCTPFGHFARLKGGLWNYWMLDSFSDSLSSSLDWFVKGFETFQDLDSSCFELQLTLPWTEQSPPSFLAHFNDQKAI